MRNVDLKILKLQKQNTDLEILKQMINIWRRRRRTHLSIESRQTIEKNRWGRTHPRAKTSDSFFNVEK